LTKSKNRVIDVVYTKEEIERKKALLNQIKTCVHRATTFHYVYVWKSFTQNYGKPLWPDRETAKAITFKIVMNTYSMHDLVKIDIQIFLGLVCKFPQPDETVAKTKILGHLLRGQIIAHSRAHI
jgi:hypothetical protein